MSEEFQEGLRKSKNIVGHIYPVIVKKGTIEIVDGKHRKQTDPTWPEKEVEFADKYSQVVFRLHANYRRSIPRMETGSYVLMLAEMLEEKGVPREQIASKLAEILPYSERWIRALLPKKYKMEEKTRKFAEVLPHPKIVTKEVPEPLEEKPDIDRDLKRLGEISEEVKWVLQNSADDVNYKAAIPRLTDPELKYCLTYETRKSGRERLEREWKKRHKAEAPDLECPACHVKLETILCRRCLQPINLSRLLKNRGGEEL